MIFYFFNLLFSRRRSQVVFFLLVFSLSLSLFLFFYSFLLLSLVLRLRNAESFCFTVWFCLLVGWMVCWYRFVPSACSMSYIRRNSFHQFVFPSFSLFRMTPRLWYFLLCTFIIHYMHVRLTYIYRYIYIKGRTCATYVRECRTVTLLKKKRKKKEKEI